MLALYFGGAFPSGQCLTLGAAENAVMLPMDTSHFTAFIQDDYEKVYALLASDYSNTLPDEQSVLHVLKIPADNVKMILQ
jgi:hypothetical protein